MFLPAGRADLTEVLDWLTQPHWLFTEEGDTVAIAEVDRRDDQKICYSGTPEGRDLLDCIYPEWNRIFMD